MLRRLTDYFGKKEKSVPPPVPSYYSSFGGLWTDRKDAVAVLASKREKLPEGMADKLQFFIDNGFVILEQAVDHQAIDNYRRDLESASREGDSALLASVPMAGPQDKDVVPLKEADLGAPLTKVLDTYALLPSARTMIFSDPIVNFLKTVFESDVLAFQGLHFEKGSTQAIHQDTAYVVLEEPMKLCASWIALEDVKAGSGELIYYPGSHRLPDWLYSGKFKHFNHERDKHEEHMSHLKALHDRSEETGLKLASFLPKKGDVLIWASDLAHGGAQIEDNTATRRSLVTHFTSSNTLPYYFRFLPEKRRVVSQAKPGCSYTTMYY